MTTSKQPGMGMRFSREELRPLAILEGLPDQHLDWFAAHGERVVLGPGEHMFERGEPADSMWLVVNGVIQGFEEIGGQWLLVATTERGQVTGMLPFSRMTHYPRYTVAPVPSEVLRLEASLFDEMQAVSLEVVRRLVAHMSDRVRGDVRLARHHVPDEALKRLERLRSADRRGEIATLTPLERSDREDDLAAWLEAQSIGEPWKLAATFGDAGLTVQDLLDVDTALRVDAPENALTCALSWLGAGLESDHLVEEIAAAAQHISTLVASVKSYSHMDRSPAHEPTDVRAGLDSTIMMLRHSLEERAIQLVRDYQSDLPMVTGNGGQLNQVWTILMENAIDAMDIGGRLLLRARRNDTWVEVEIVDDGSGIARDIRGHIFEPFFTTKDVGSGTGLSLSVAKRCVETHQGHIDVRSRPGRTAMCVRLPMALEGGAKPNGMN
jgi:signal transduction histidine kinase